jgi:hypothetical protein
MFRRYIYFTILLVVLLSHTVEASSVTGFIPGQIWYSTDSLVEGSSVKIYTAVWNGDTTPLTAHVAFYDKTTILGSRDVVVSPSTLADVSISWKVTAGDHNISAKITSSTTTISGKKQTVSVDNTQTEEDHQFVPILIKKQDGTVATSTDLVKSQVDKIGGEINSSITDAIPTSITKPFNSNISSVDSLRVSTYTEVSHMKVDTQTKLDALNGEKVATSKGSSVKPATSSGVDKPIAYVKLFFLSVLAFVLGNKIVFYGLGVIIIFLILRSIYRKIRNR